LDAAVGKISVSHEYNYQYIIFDRYQLLKVLEPAMFAIASRIALRQVNTNVYHHHTHADRRSMGLLASVCSPLRQSPLSEQGK